MNIIDIIYPTKECLICRKRAFRYGFCKDCLSNMEFIEGRICEICGKPLGQDYSMNLCPDCMNGRIFDEARSALVYNEFLHEMIYLFKYKGKVRLAESFGQIMFDMLKKWNLDVNIIIPIPMHVERLEQRGYNQAYLLAKEISKMSGIPLKDELIKIKNTSVQAKLDRIQRIYNMRGAFSLKGEEKIDGVNVLLVDDILTTGATVDAASSILKKEGVSRVYVLTLATGKNT